MAKKRRGGRKAKTEAQKKREAQDKLDIILRIASMFHNIQRNHESRKIARRHVTKFRKELLKTRDRKTRTTLKFLLKDYQSTADKMENFIREDMSVINKELKSIKVT